MLKASKCQDYERAADYRNRLQALANIQATQNINSAEVLNADVIGIVQKGGKTAIQIFFFRNGYNYGAHVFFPSHDASDSTDDILMAFLSQFYETLTPPPQLIMNQKLIDEPLLISALNERHGMRLKIITPLKGPKADLLNTAVNNASQALARSFAEKASEKRLLDEVGHVFSMASPPKRIEIYDNSHISGKNAYGVMVSYREDGFYKQGYRKYSIKTDMSPGDDYAMMREVMSRRFKSREAQDQWPNLMLIDGGLGQLNAVLEIMDSLKIEGITVVGISKGPDRDAGREQFFMRDKEPFKLTPTSPSLYFLQRLRDEAHRYAITTHRKSRIKDIKSSPLDAIPGIGHARKKALLKHFGSTKGISGAAVKDLMNVPGISPALAKIIYDHFQDN
jgi:excinuclease ABC subunit C